MIKLSKIMLMICCLLWEGGISAGWAQSEFNPESPEEPQATDICKITVSADPNEAAYVSGSGKYKVGTGGSVYINASANNTRDFTYEFLYWTQNGVPCSYEEWFCFTPEKGNFNFVAHYQKNEIEFDPTSPEEPSSSNIKRRFYLYLTPNIEGAGSFNIASGSKYAEGSELYLYAYENAYYQLEGWKIDGEMICSYNGFYFTMPNHETTIEAVFSEISFDPESPMDPSHSGQGNVDVADPLRQYVTLLIGNENNLKVDKTSIIFNANKSLDYEAGVDATKFFSASAQYQIYSMDEHDLKYSVNQRPVDSGIVPLGFYAKTSGTAMISAGRLERAAKLYDKVLDVEHDLSQGAYSFECESGTFEDRFELHTPINMLMGDINNDNKVSVTDLILLIELKKGEMPAIANPLHADMNYNGAYDDEDLQLLVDLLLEVK